MRSQGRSARRAFLMRPQIEKTNPAIKNPPDHMPIDRGLKFEPILVPGDFGMEDNLGRVHCTCTRVHVFVCSQIAMIS